ncbi:MAG: class I SAM-dependent methyltransferase [Spirochaetales bacterium]|nr:class I SAM-dependent methyltransferase [Spirochaetales bacterium]
MSIVSKPWKWDETQQSLFIEPSYELYSVLAYWKKKGFKRILDLGCGTGRNSVFFAENGFSVNAFDLSEEGLTVLKKSIEGRDLDIMIDHGDMISLPYANNTFDGIIAFHSIYHTDKQGLEKVITEIERVGKPGCEVFVTFNSKTNPSFSNPTNKVINDCTVVKTEGLEAGIPHVYVDINDLRRVLKNFTLKRVQHIEDITERGRSYHYFIWCGKKDA